MRRATTGKAYAEVTASARKVYDEAIDEAIVAARKVYDEAITAI